MFEHPETMRQIVSDRTGARLRAAELRRQARRRSPRRRHWPAWAVLTRH
jgi:hypothetical protein